MKRVRDPKNILNPPRELEFGAADRLLAKLNNPESNIGDFEKALKVRDEAGANFLRELRRADQDAEKWDDWQRHINSGAEPFGE